MSEFLKHLNPEQRQAVEQVYGTVLVLAGPGTGKTHMLTSRIAYILGSTDANPENILCLTFTEAAAVEMRVRLQKLMGNEAYKLKISTFHGFSEWVMGRYPDVFASRRRGRTVAEDDLQRVLAFRGAIESKRWEYFSDTHDPFYWQRSFLSAISTLKRENVSSAALRNLIPDEQKRLEEDPDNFYKRDSQYGKKGEWKSDAKAKIERKIGQMRELADLWDVYEEKLSGRGYFDFDDQLMWVVDALQKNKGLRADLQEQFQWILADEYQDTNAAQNQILWALTDFDEAPNLMVVGDDDQAIYRFQGASSANIRELQERFVKRTDVTLTANYRSGQKILDSATRVIAHNLDRISSDKILVASGENKNIESILTKASFGSRYSELNFLVEQIRMELEAGIEPSEIAILVRQNREVQEIARELPKFGIPVSAQIFENIFENDAVRHLIRLLTVFSDPVHSERLIEVLHAPWFEVGSEMLLKLTLEANGKDRLAVDVLQEEGKKNEALQRIFDLLVTTRKNYLHCRPAVLAEKLLYESGLAEFISSEQYSSSSRDWQHMRKFIDWIRGQDLDQLSELLERIGLHQDLRIPIKPDVLPADRRSVRILTAHGAKGREFEVVFIPGLLDGMWGNRRVRHGLPLPHLFRSDHDENEDERRLFFVALTRAKRKLFLSFASQDFSGRERNPSQFYHEVPDELCTIISTDEVEERVQKLLPVFLGTDQEMPAFTKAEEDILREQVGRFIWSATSLQNYLDCPRRFLYQNILRIPRRPVPAMALGVSLHQALERFLRPLKDGKALPDVHVLLDEFTHALRGQNLEKEVYERFLIQGQERLSQYFEARKESFSGEVLLEFDVGRYTPRIENIPVRGVMDKIEFHDSSRKRGVVVDYKSGKPRSIKSGERLWRQLVFYDLLLCNTPQIPWQAEGFVLEFLSPDPRGQFVRKTIDISSQDREQVLKELREAHSKVLNLEFPLVPNPEEDDEIDYWQRFGR